jgi:hypothetical protein
VRQGFPRRSRSPSNFCYALTLHSEARIHMRPSYAHCLLFVPFVTRNLPGFASVHSRLQIPQRNFREAGKTRC